MERLPNAKRVAGVKQTKNAVAQGKASVVYIAEDVSFGIVEELVSVCRDADAEVVKVKSAKELAKLCKLDVPCSAAAVLND